MNAQTFLNIALALGMFAAILWAIGEHETRKKCERIIKANELDSDDLSSEGIKIPTLTRHLNEKQG